MRIIFGVVLLLLVSTYAFRGLRDTQYNTSYTRPAEDTGLKSMEQRNNRWGVGQQNGSSRVSSTTVPKPARETTVVGTGLRSETPRAYASDRVERSYYVTDVHAPVTGYEVLKQAPDYQRRVAVAEVPEVERRVRSAPVYDYEVVQRAEVIAERDYIPLYETYDVPERVVWREAAPEVVRAPVVQYKVADPVEYISHYDIIPEVHHVIKEAVVELPEYVRRIAAAPEISQVTRNKRYVD